VLPVTLSAYADVTSDTKGGELKPLFLLGEYPKAWGNWVEWFLSYARVLLFSTSFGPLVIFDWKRAPRFGVLSLSAKMYMLQHRSQWAHALNRSAIGALVTGIALYRNLFRGVGRRAERNGSPS
jgi:hypothetical protein